MRDEFDEIDKMSEEELFDEMAKIMAEVHSDPEIKRPIITDDSRDYIFSEIRKIEEREARANLSDEDKRLLEYGRRYKRQLHRRKYWILAAVFVLVLAMGMTSVGGPQRFFNRVIDRISGRDQEVIYSEEGIVVTDGWNEEEAYDAIEEKFGFRPVKLDYLPEGVVFESVEISDNTQEIKILYTMNNDIYLCLIIYPNYREGSVGTDVEDIVRKEYYIQKDDLDISIKEYWVEELQEARWGASFLKDATFYLYMSRNTNQVEFEKIIQNLYTGY